MADPRANITGGTVGANVLNFKSLVDQISAATLKALLVDRNGNSIIVDGAVPVSGVTVEQGASATDVAGPLVQGVVDDGPPAYIDGEVRPISMNAQGRVRVAAVIIDPSEVWDCLFKGAWGSPSWAKETW